MFDFLIPTKKEKKEFEQEYLYLEIETPQIEENKEKDIEENIIILDLF